MYTWEQLAQANTTIKTTPIKGKDYAEVPQRIKAFRSICPGGAIITEMLSNENGVCVFRATVYDEEKNIIGTGTAYEKEKSSYINKTSYIENCETSAVGRALGMCGFGIDTSIASAEELQNAILNQGNPPQEEQPKAEQPKAPKAEQPKKQASPRKMLIAKLRELDINVDDFAAEHNLTSKTDPEIFKQLLAELEGNK